MSANNTYSTPDTERLTLCLLLGKRVRGAATLTGRRKTGKVRLTCLHDVVLDDGEALSHLWVQLSPYLERQPPGLRIRFEALVQEYPRMDGSTDYTLAQVRMLGKDAP